MKKQKAVLESEADVIAKPDTDLDLDDVAATSPKAKAELEELRAENARLRADVAKWQALAEGFENTCNSAIGNRRILADLCAAQQPLGAEFEAVWDAAEGELYEK